MADSLHDPSAALIIIGNEVLSGKLVDQNSPFLLKELFNLGVNTKRVVTIPDEPDVIAHEVRLAAKNHDYVITTGGIGPTHDDVTIESIAKAFAVDLIESPILLKMLTDHFGDEMTPAARRMALIPEGSRLITHEDLRYPLLVMGNVYVFPGVPQYLRAKFHVLRDEFQSRPFHLLEVATTETEAQLAAPLERTAKAFPKVEFGSYPKFAPEKRWVLLTLQSKEVDILNKARAYLIQQLDATQLIDLPT